MSKIVTLGEIMLRLSPAGHSRFVQVDNFDVIWGGGEANVAVSCANYGHEACFVTKLPTHEIGQAAVNALRRYGVDTRFIARGGNRVGIYYCETGASMRPSKVIYDRAGSAIAEAPPISISTQSWKVPTGSTGAESPLPSPTRPPSLPDLPARPPSATG